MMHDSKPKTKNLYVKMKETSCLNKVKYFVKELHMSGFPEPNVIMHGSLAQGKQSTSVTDIDLIIYLDEGMNTDTTTKLSRRREELSIIKAAYRNTNIMQLPALNKYKFPISLLVIPGCESRWDIVKNTKKYDFLNTLFNKSRRQYRKISGNRDLFKPDQKLRNCIKLMNSEYGIWNEYADLVKNAQIVRQRFCQGTLDGEGEIFESFKGLCRTWSGLLGGFDQVDGYNYMTEELKSFEQCASTHIDFINGKMYQECGCMTVETLVALSEISSMYALDKLDQHLPEPKQHVENIIKEFMNSVRSNNSNKLT
jgi:hypothetical protein